MLGGERMRSRRGLTSVYGTRLPFHIHVDKYKMQPIELLNINRAVSVSESKDYPGTKPRSGSAGRTACIPVDSAINRPAP